VLLKQNNGKENNIWHAHAVSSIEELWGLLEIAINVGK
jgi:hypothetical protein